MTRKIVMGCCCCGPDAKLERSKPRRGYYRCPGCLCIYRIIKPPKKPFGKSLTLVKGFGTQLKNIRKYSFALDHSS